MGYITLRSSVILGNYYNLMIYPDLKVIEYFAVSNEVERGRFVLVIEVEDKILKMMLTLIKSDICHLNLHSNIYQMTVIDCIEDILKRYSTLYRILSQEEILGLQLSNDEYQYFRRRRDVLDYDYLEYNELF